MFSKNPFLTVHIMGKEQIEEETEEIIKKNPAIKG
jgi:hypothetical protein